jgi:hypothetical protein
MAEKAHADIGAGILPAAMKTTASYASGIMQSRA